MMTEQIDRQGMSIFTCFIKVAHVSMYFCHPCIKKWFCKQTKTCNVKIKTNKNIQKTHTKKGINFAMYKCCMLVFSVKHEVKQ